jgi:hypothetical protein
MDAQVEAAGGRIESESLASNGALACGRFSWMRSKLTGARTSILAGIVIVLVFALLFGLMLWLTSGKHNTNRENGLYQFIFLAVGVGFSYLVGRQSAQVSAADVIRPHAKAAVRRLVNLGAGIRGFAEALNAERAYMEAEAKDGMVPVAHVVQAHDMLSIPIEAQTRTAVDAIEDWREFVPEEIAAVEQQGRDDD